MNWQTETPEQTSRRWYRRSLKEVVDSTIKMAVQFGEGNQGKMGRAATSILEELDVSTEEIRAVKEELQPGQQMPRP